MPHKAGKFTSSLAKNVKFQDTRHLLGFIDVLILPERRSEIPYSQVWPLDTSEWTQPLFLSTICSNGWKDESANARLSN